MFRGLGRSRGRSLLGRSSATASGLAATSLALARLNAAENVFKQFDDWAAIQLVALRLANLFAGGRFAASYLLACGRFAASYLLASLNFASRFAASGFWAASLRGRTSAASLRLVANASLRFKQLRNVIEQITNRSAMVLVALFATTARFFAASRLCFFAASGLRFFTNGGCRTALGWLFATGDLGASFAIAAVTAVQPKDAIEKFKAEPLIAQDYAHQERSKNHLAFH